MHLIWLAGHRRERIERRVQPPRLAHIWLCGVGRHQPEPTLGEPVIPGEARPALLAPPLGLSELLEVVGADERAPQHVARDREIGVLLVRFARRQNRRGYVLRLVIEVAERAEGPGERGIGLSRRLQVLSRAGEE